MECLSFIGTKIFHGLKGLADIISNGIQGLQLMEEIIPHKGICFQRTGCVLVLRQGDGDVDFHHTLFCTCLIISVTKRGWGEHNNSFNCLLGQTKDFS